MRIFIKFKLKDKLNHNIHVATFFSNAVQS